MNKKILGVFIGLLAIAMLAIPVYASPTKGQKVPITIRWTLVPGGYLGSNYTGIVEHRHALGTWNVTLAIDGGATYNGTFAAVREVLIVPKKDGNNILWRERGEMWFPSAGGGFEGNFCVLMDGVGNPLEMRAKAHGLLQGYGAFEGQTINAGHHWVGLGPIVWTGYLLKP